MPPAPESRDSGNFLLNSFSDDEFDRLAPVMQPVKVTTKQVIHQFEADVTHIYFPTTALFSLLVILQEDDPIEAATVGKEGFVGLAALLGVESSPHRVICQMNGEGFRLPVQALLDSMGRDQKLRKLLHRYIAFSLRSTGQTIACNAMHTIEARACRWLLMLHDQAGRDEFPMTHEFLAYMLGVRRQSVTVVAGSLQNAGLIGYRRGIITILDREMLEEAGCECYAAVRDYYGRVMK
jgi:CRP-like cAMP-binding protein